MWVYTAYGERVGMLHGVSRPAGQQAMCGYEPVHGSIAKSWEKLGYIEWKEETQSDDTRDASGTMHE